MNYITSWKETSLEDEGIDGWTILTKGDRLGESRPDLSSEHGNEL
jgi:hypothetical protein